MAAPPPHIRHWNGVGNRLWTLKFTIVGDDIVDGRLNPLYF